LAETASFIFNSFLKFFALNFLHNRKMSDTQIDSFLNRSNRWAIVYLITLPMLAIAGCSKSATQPERVEESRPPVVQDMNIVQPEASN
jgi:hypothetical protein